MANKNSVPTKVIIPCRISFTNIWEPKAIQDSEPKYSVSCVIPKSDKKTLAKIRAAVEAAKKDGKAHRWNGKLPRQSEAPPARRQHRPSGR